MLSASEFPSAPQPQRPRRLRGIERRLVRSFDDERPTQDTLTQLRTAAFDYGRRGRRLGLPPEQLVIALKRLLVSQGTPEFAAKVFEEEPTPGVPVTTTRYGHVLGWCLDGYYEEKDARRHA